MRTALWSLSIPVLVAGFAAGQAQIGELDFHPDEVLFGYGGESVFECYYYVGTIVTPGSEKHNNQEELIAVRDGKSYWSRFVFRSHKAEATELQLGSFVFYPLEFVGVERIDAERYRSADWDLGQISSLKQLARGAVEVDGTPCDLGLLRLPDVPLQGKE